MRFLPVLRGTLLVAALIYGALGAELWFVQDRLVFPGAFGGLHDPAEVAKTAAASRLVRVDIPRADGPAVTVCVTPAGSVMVTTALGVSTKPLTVGLPSPSVSLASRLVMTGAVKSVSVTVTGRLVLPAGSTAVTV